LSAWAVGHGLPRLAAGSGSPYFCSFFEIEAKAVGVPFLSQGFSARPAEVSASAPANLNSVPSRVRIVVLHTLIFVRSGMPEPSYEELKTRLAELEKQQGTRRTGSLEFRVGEKGGISVYGLGRFPVTLYYEQWIRLLDSADKLREFMEENKSKLKLKG
jgi:hypothetical protein